MNNDKIIKFYGGLHPDLFEIERRCMDRDGHIINYLNEHLPKGRVLDVGAGNGFTAEKLSTSDRHITALEPDDKMIDLNKPLLWAKGIAQDIPFHDNSFDAMYSTWAFFFDGVKDIDDGIREVERIIKSSGMIFIVDNYGNDEFTSLANTSIHNSLDFWTERGFEYEIIHTHFKFDSLDEAKELFTFYFGDNGSRIDKLEFEYKVIVYTKTCE